MVAAETRPRQLDRFLGTDLMDEYVFYDAAGEQVHVLNATARRVYLMCDGSHTVEQMVQAFVAEYEIEEPTARADIDETLRRLEELGLVSLS
jgi:hypothetical protein